MIQVTYIGDDGLPPYKVLYCMDSKTTPKLMCSYWRLTEDEVRVLYKDIKDVLNGNKKD